MQTEQFQLHSRMEESHWWFTGRREILRRLVREILSSSGRSILDIGCGTGGNLASFASEHRCTGWDPFEEAIGLARRRYPSVRFLSGPFDEAAPSFPSQPDLILVMDVLEHVERDRDLLSRLVSMVRPGGQLLITVPAGMELWSPHDVAVGHFRRYSRPQLEALWATEPVSVPLVSYFNARLYPAVRLARFWTRRTGCSGGEAETDFRVPPAPFNRLLDQIFASEAAVLTGLLGKKPGTGFRRGVSLIAVLKKKGGQRNGS